LLYVRRKSTKKSCYLQPWPCRFPNPPRQEKARHVQAAAQNTLKQDVSETFQSVSS
jgi:hypothetical protein